MVLELRPGGLQRRSSSSAESNSGDGVSSPSRSLPGSALELRYSHGGGSLPSGSTAHLEPFGSASTGGVVRRSHRARWSSAREDSTKVRVQEAPPPGSPSSASLLTSLMLCTSTRTGRAGLCWGPALTRVWMSAAPTRTRTSTASVRSSCRPADRRTCRRWPSCCRSSWRPSTRRSSKRSRPKVKGQQESTPP